MRQEIEQAVQAAVHTIAGTNGAQVELTRPDEQFGDYATNVALQLAGSLHRKPRDVAEELAVKVRENLGDTATEVSVAGPGFLNIRLSDTALIAGMGTEPAKTLAGKTYIVEYSDPNPFKPLHVGHLYTTLVGDILARLVEEGGAQTIRINYSGDVGLHVARAMWAIIKQFGGEYPEKLAAIPEAERASWLGECYIEGSAAYKNDERTKAAIEAINKRVYQVHQDNDHESPFAQIYWTGRQWSYDYFKVLYEQLDVAPFTRYIPESEVTPLGVQMVMEQLEKGVYEKSDGAVVFRGEKVGLHTRVFINSQGLPTYEAKDVGLSLTKWRDYHFDESIIITGSEQGQYMAVVIASIKQFAPEPAECTRHLTHGVVLRNGVKMSSRSGNAVTALEVIDLAREAGKASGTNPSEDTILAAVKYAFAKNRIGSNIEYNPSEAVALEGNSGPYLQYAHARARSILAKSNAKSQNIEKLEPAERSLVRKMSEYAEVVERATAELLPHYVTTYLYELAQAFNSFYEHNRVIGNEREAVRLRLVARYADVLKDGLGLLGITAPDHM